jgi:hypothetical protein
VLTSSMTSKTLYGRIGSVTCRAHMSHRGPRSGGSICFRRACRWRLSRLRYERPHTEQTCRTGAVARRLWMAAWTRRWAARLKARPQSGHTCRLIDSCRAELPGSRNAIFWVARRRVTSRVDNCRSARGESAIVGTHHRQARKLER